LAVVKQESINEKIEKILINNNEDIKYKSIEDITTYQRDKIDE